MTYALDTHRDTTLRELRETTRQARISATKPGAARVVLISEGKGSARGRHLYSADALRKSVAAFEGAKCFLDHPSTIEQDTLPERSVSKIAGYYKDVALGTSEGRTAIVGTLVFTSTEAGIQARAMVESTLRYQEIFPDAQLLGLSIDAEGPSHEELVDGETWNAVERIEVVHSCDVVTFPARGGRALKMLESAWRESDSWRRRFREALAERNHDRILAIHGLQQKVSAAESALDPTDPIVREMIAEARRYLAQELKGEKNMKASVQPYAVDVDDAGDRDVHYVTCEACGHQTAVPAKQDEDEDEDEAVSEAASTCEHGYQGGQCPACDHESVYGVSKQRKRMRESHASRLWDSLMRGNSQERTAAQMREAGYSASAIWDRLWPN